MLNEESRSFCPECVQQPQQAEPTGVGRRDFIRTVSGGVAALAGMGAVGMPRIGRADEAASTKPAKPSEALVKELYASLSAEQKKAIVLPWNHKDKDGNIVRLRMYNGAINDQIINDEYTKPQQELVGRILRSICSDEEGYRRITRNGTFDSSGSLEGCGAHIFGNPDEGQYAWVFTGHHLTVRCDGNSEEATAFGGPMYYGHSPNGYSTNNVFNFQTKAVLSVFDALDENQRKKAIVAGNPGEQIGSLKSKKPPEQNPGIGYKELSSDQKQLVERVMRECISPYRKEDADEVMQIIKAIGGMEKIHLAFYEDAKMADGQRWHFWRLEGPGFVWNYRVLPHVHCFVLISSKIA
jgi:hypothetical protein